MSSFPSHGCYKVDNLRIHPRTLEVETKNNPLPASFYDLDISFSGIVRYYTDPPQDEWNTGLSLDCIRQLTFHEFAVRSQDYWYMLDVDKRSAIVLFVHSNALPLTKTTWLTNDVIMPYGYKCSPYLKETLLRSVCPRENTVMSSYYYEDRLVVKLYRKWFSYCCLTGASRMSAIEFTPVSGLCIVDYDFDRNVVVGTRCMSAYANSYFITNDGVTIGKARVSNDELTTNDIAWDAVREKNAPPKVDPETEQRIKELSKCVMS